MTNGEDDFVATVVIPVADADKARELIEAMAEDVRQWVRHLPGFVSANYHISLDGKRVFNYARWTNEKAYLDGFRADPRSAAMREQILALAEGGPEMVGYQPVRSVVAG
ncbi:Antibiotic biosynthesis monooxygenase [Catenulispora acidiphila DSM 44928]|uniref:Antibiotic biosynthesis monooxygenase n=1 Tax=Catenulispora acidiphila (strain DSM 44928 / JCM 14897 / NBRC 102108 / NRRL B-24433 / ID139908) TaxID=479433 RepID=C7PWR0_CATAD|nr:antibiotic biosynthesis monooxygenase [Catenulispora acidiphila]ACU75340.1 Antibiotic biosynthesis monooxygenase [Catenulispora acidiphila DSM 44928]